MRCSTRCARQAEPDLAGGLAFPLPAQVICEILGIPLPRAEAFHRWSDDMGGFTGNIGPTLVEIAPRAMASYVELEEFIAEMVAGEATVPKGRPDRAPRRRGVRGRTVAY